MRFALVIEGGYLAPWHLDCVNRLRTVASLEAVIVSPPHAAGAVRATPRWFRRLGGARADRTIAVASQFGNVEEWRPDSGPGHTALFDFAIMIGAGPEPKGFGRLVRHGTWRFLHEWLDDPPPFLREVDQGAATTYAALISRSLDADDVVLEEGWLATQQRSYARQLDRMLATIVEWPVRAARRLESGPANLERRLEPTEARSRYRPNLIRLLVRLARRRLAFALERLFRHPQWNVGLLPVSIEVLLQPGGYSDDAIAWFPLAGRHRFLADPFGIESDGMLHVLCEEFPYRSGRGYIASFTWPARDDVTQEALRPPVHASYPFLIDDAGAIYCVPETAAAGEIALHQAVDFPRAWRRCGTLIDVAGLDPTVFRHEGRWWLMCTRRGRDEDAELYIWHAEQLRGPWIPHARNPVKTDVRSARPGGPTFIHDGALHRAAQDCSRYYGWRIAIQRVDVLTPTEFRERNIMIIEPSATSRYPAGRHTLTPVGDRVLIDGHRRVFVWHAFQAFIKIMARDAVRRLGRRGP